MTSLIIFACVCSSGIALCLAYIVVLLVNERKRNPAEKPQRRPITYTYYETEDTLNVDVE